jgi:hypothetical protein
VRFRLAVFDDDARKRFAAAGNEAAGVSGMDRRKTGMVPGSGRTGNETPYRIDSGVCGGAAAVD